MKSYRALIKIIFRETIKFGLAILGHFIVIISLSAITQNKVFRFSRKLTEDQVTVLSSKFMALQMTTDPDIQA